MRGTWVRDLGKVYDHREPWVKAFRHKLIHEMIDIVAIPIFDAWALFIHRNRIRKTERLRTVFSKQNYMVYVVKIYTYTKRIFCH